MAEIASEVMLKVSIILADAGGTRWPLPELLKWLNDGLREITLHAPSAVSSVEVIDMVEGTRQTLPDGFAALLRVNSNIDATGNRGVSVRPTRRDILDQQIPGWQSAAKLAFNAIVYHVIDDPLDRRSFLVAPGNDGTGKIECVVAKRPTEIAAPANPLDIEAYADVIELDDIFINSLVDYILYRAFSKDIAVPGIPQRAQAHYQQFANALGINMQTEMAMNPDTNKSAKM